MLNWIGSGCRRSCLAVAVAATLAPPVSWAQPVNDNFANATPLAGWSGAYSGSNVGATREAGEPYAYYSMGSSTVWFDWVAPYSGAVTFDTRGSLIDTILAAYIGSNLTSLSLLASNDDFYGLQSRVDFNATAGTDYRIVVAGFSTSQGSYRLNWQYGGGSTNPPPPSLALNQVQFSSSAQTVMENTPGFVKITVVTTGGQTNALAVDYATSDGTAVAGLDYFGASGHLVFNPGESSKTFVVQIIDNPAITSNKTFQVTLFNPSGVTTLGAVSNTVVTIVESVVQTFASTAGQFQFVMSQYSPELYSSVYYTNSYYYYSSVFGMTEHEYRSDWPEYPTDIRWRDYRSVPGALITVNRVGGSSGRVMVDYMVTNAVDPLPAAYYQTNPISPYFPRPAVPYWLYSLTGSEGEYIPQTGTLVFDDFQTSTNFIVRLTGSGISRTKRSTNMLVNLATDYTTLLSNGLPEVQLILFNPRPAPEENPDLVQPTLGPISNAVLQIVDVSSSGQFAFERLNWRVDEFPGRHWADNGRGVREVTVTVALPRPPGDDGADRWVEISVGNPVDAYWMTTAGSDWAGAGRDFANQRIRLTFTKNDYRKGFTIQIPDDTLVEFNEDIPLWMTDWIGKNDGKYPPPNPLGEYATITILYDDPPPGALDREWNPDKVPYTIPPFNSAPGANGQVYSVATQPDGKTVLGGDFTSVNAIVRNRVARMNFDGSLDTGFLAYPSTGADGFVSQVVVLPAAAGTNAGKILIVGGFTSFNGFLRDSVARLNQDGSLDFSFNPGTGADGIVWSMAVQDDGKLVIGGDFVTYNEVSSPHVARLNTDGSLDATFNPVSGADSTVSAVALEASSGNPQRIYIAGNFQSYNGAFCGRVARLNTDGSLDTTFFAGAGTDGQIFALGLQSNGQLLVAGAFASMDSRERHNLARLNTDGSLDLSYNPGTGPDNAVYAITMQANDRAYIGGLFTSYNTTRRMGLASVNVDGTLDATFLDTAYNQFAGFCNPFSFQPPNFVKSIAIQADGNVMVGGSFTNVGGNEPRWVTDWDAQGLVSPINTNLLYNATNLIYYSYYSEGFYTPCWTRQDKATRYNIARLIGTWGTTTNYVGTNNAQVITQNPSQGPGNVAFQSGAFSIEEYQSGIYVTMTRTNGRLGTLGAFAGTTNRTALAGTDYTGQTNVPVAFFEESPPATDASPIFMMSDGDPGPQYFFVPIINDGLIDGNETVDLGAYQPFGEITLGGEWIPLGGALGLNMATLTIIDGTVSHGTIAFSSTDYSVIESGTNAIVTLVRTNGSVGSASVDYYTVSGTAVGGIASDPTRDYTTTRGTITFPSGVTNATILVPIYNDTSVEFDETFTVVLTNATGGAILPGGRPTSSTAATVTIIDDDFQAGRLNFAAATFTTNEGAGFASITVTRTGGSVGQLSVWVGATNGTGTNPAVAGVDFVPVTTNLVWAFGETGPKTFLVPLIDDNLVKGTRAVSLNLFSPKVGQSINQAALGNRYVATLFILDDDAYGLFTFSAPTYVMDENGTSLTITVQRKFGSAGTNWVDYATADESAIDGVDYVGVYSTLRFLPGEVSKTFSVAPIDNSLQDGDRIFLVSLFNPQGGAGLVGWTNAEVTIVDDESALVPAGAIDTSFNIGTGPNLPVYALALQPDKKLIIAGEFTTFNNILRKNLARLLDNGTIDTTFDVGTGCNDQLRAIALQDDGRLLIGGFFTTFNGVNCNRIARLNVDGTLDTFFNSGAGADNPIYALAVQDDGRILVGGAFASYNGVTQPNLIRLNTNGTLHGAFKIGAGPNGPVFAIALQSDSKILIGGDFTAVNNNTNYARLARLNWDGSLDASFVIGAGADSTVRAILLQSDGKIVVGGSFTNFAGRPNRYCVRLQPGGAVDATFMAGLAGANDSVYTLALQADGKLLAGGNFTRFNGVTRNRLTRLNQDGSTDPSINFGEGANGFVAALAIQPDRKIVLGGGFTMFDGQAHNHLARLQGGSLAGAGSLEFSTPFYAVNELDGVALLNVMRRGGTYGTVGVTCYTMDGSASDTVDYRSVLTNLTFPEGEVLQMVAVPILNDLLVEDSEIFYALLDYPTTNTFIGNVPIAVVTIINSISLVNFSKPEFNVAEATPSGTAVVNIQRTGATNTTVTVSYQAVASTNLPNAAVAGINFTPVAGTLTFLPGQTNKVFLVPILNDGIPDGNRPIQLQITAAGPTNLIVLGLTNAVLTILDAQFAPGILSFAQTVYRVPEHGTNAAITVIRNHGASGIVSVRCTTSDGTAAPGAVPGVAGVDYGRVDIVLGFADGETNKTFQVPIIDNPRLQTNTTVNLSLSQPGGGATFAPPTNAVLVIEDFETSAAHLSFVSTNFGVSESDAFALISVVRTDNLGSRVTVDFATTDGTAYDGLDYLGTNGTLVFAPNETVKSFTVPIIFDQLYEPTETVVLTLANPSVNAAIGAGYALLYITNTPLAGSVDDAFNARWGADGPVYAAVFDANENLYVAGSFQYLNGLGINSVGRMTTNGTVDPTFNPGAGPNGAIYAVGRSTNGLVVGGAFTNFNNVGRSHVARLKYDGSVDPAFNSLNGSDGDVLALTVQLDDRVLIGGSFRTVGGQAFNNIARLNQNGTVDANFRVGGGANSTNGTVRAIALQAYGLTGSPILIGGDFTRFNGVQRHYLARLNPDGSLDNTFATGLGPDGPVYGVAVLGDGQVLIVGGFATVDGVPRNGVARLNADGTVDLTFDPGTGSFDPGLGTNALVRAVDVQVDGKIVLAGDFTHFNGNAFNRLVRLDPVGTVDPTFHPGTGANRRIFGLALGSSGQAVPKQGMKMEAMARSSVEPRIVGGKPANITNFPYQVALIFQPFDPNNIFNSQFCGGSIVNDQWILTAAHCSVGQSPAGVAVAVGVTDLTQPQAGRIFNVDRIVIHPNYNPATMQNDVALWHLAQPITFNGNYPAAALRLVSPADVGTGVADPGVVATITGWGSLSFGGNYPFALQVGAAPITTASAYPPGTITSDMIMAGYAQGGVDTCQGDSGGPLVVTNAQKIIMEAGVTSWGNGCAQAGYPGVYARVSWFYDWIISQINQIPPGPGQSTSSKIAVVGEFNQFNGLPRKRIAVLDNSGDNSASFDPAALPNNVVFAMAIHTNAAQPTLQGKIVAAGMFTQLAGVDQRNRVARLNLDGTIDTNFNVGFGPDQPVRALAMQPDGRIIIGGLFTNVNQTPRAWLARLNTDGSLDPNYNGGVGLNGAVYSLVLQPDQKIVIGGIFTLVYGANRVGIARLGTNGTVDTTFNPGAGANGAVNAIVMDGDGGYIIGGDFTTIDNQPRNHIARLMTNGVLDTSFVVGAGFNGSVYALAITGSGRILVGGGFTAYNVTNNVARLARLHTDGNLDTSFNPTTLANPNPGADDFISSISLQPDGKILIGGAFVTYNGLLRNRLARLNADGTLDPTINFGTGADRTIYNTMLEYYDGMIVVGGAFTQFNGQPRVAIARLLAGTNTGSGMFMFSSSGYEVSEAGTNVVVKVLRVGGATGPASVRLVTADGSARAGRDYVATNVSLTFNEAENFKPVSIRVLDNLVVDGDRTFTVNLSSPSSAAIGSPSNAVVTILDNDSVISFAQAQYTVTEGGGVARILLTRTGGVTDAATVGYATGTNGTAVTNLDYVPVSGTLTFNPGVSVQSFDVPIIDNTVISLNQTVSLVLSNVTGPATLGLSNATLVIINNDFGSGVLSLATNSYVVSMKATNALITVLRTNGFTGPVGVSYFTSDGTAIAGVDYVSTNGVLSFSDGETNKTIVVGIINNALPVGDVVFRVTITNATGGAAIAGDPAASVRITDHLVAPGSVDPTFDPGAGGSATVRALAADTAGRIIAGGDFTMFGGTNHNYVVRLNLDGSLDTNFLPPLALVVTNPVVVYSTNSFNGLVTAKTNSVAVTNWLGQGANQFVSSVAAMADGRSVIGGGFSTFNSLPFNHIARLYANGAPDTNFMQLPVFDGTVTAVAVRTNTRVVAGGSFNLPTKSITQLRPNATLDTSFNPGAGANQPVQTIAILTNDSLQRVIIGGAFSMVDITPAAHVARLAGDGSVDPAFTATVITNGTVYCVAAQGSNVLVGGDFMLYGSTNRSHLIRLNPNGSLDAGFKASNGPNANVYAIGFQSQGQILIAGDFTSFNGTNRVRLARLNPDGSLDGTFDPGFGPNSTVLALVVLPDDSFVIGGDFTVVNGSPRSRVARIIGVMPVMRAVINRNKVITVNSVPGTTYYLDASSDLHSWVASIYTTLATNWTASLMDTNATGLTHRFYRVRSNAAK